MKYSPLIEKAIQTSAQAHRKQYRKGNPDLPYVSHPYSVFTILSEYTTNENVLITGLLHDVLEDADPKEYSEQKLKDIFGDKVVSIIKEVSEQKNGDLQNIEAKVNWEERKLIYLNHLKTVSTEALMVSTADKVHNLISTLDDFSKEGNVVWDRFNAPKNKQLWFYREFTSIISERLNNKLSEKLRDLTKQMEDISRLKR
jgi:(p)ppGpp synthase/HD superfamily hydrolase